MSKDKKARSKGRPSVWTDELIEELLKLWQQGLSATEIARRLGKGLSRNAVIGKIHRLRAAGKAPEKREGAQGTQQPPRHKSAQNKDASPMTTTRSTTARGDAGQAVAVKVKPEVETAPQAVEQSQLRIVAAEEGLVKDIMDLKHHSCRWPIGTPGEEDFSYCGRRAADGGPYCKHHATIAYTSSVGSSQKRAAG